MLIVPSFHHFESHWPIFDRKLFIDQFKLLNLYFLQHELFVFTLDGVETNISSVNK